MKYQALVEQIPAVTFMAPLDGSTSELYVSPQIRDLLGFSPQEWLEDPVLWYRQLHPEDKQRWQEQFARTVNSGEPFRADYRFIVRDGRVVWVHGEAKLLKDDAGGPLCLQGVAFDITEIKQAEAEFRQFHLLVSSVQDYAIYSIDPAGCVLTWNQGAERIKGYRADEVVGRHVSMFFLPADIERGDLAHAMRQAAASGRYESEGWRVRKDGTQFWANVVMTALRDASGTLHGFSKITRDLTERRQIEERLRPRTTNWNIGCKRPHGPNALSCRREFGVRRRSSITSARCSESRGWQCRFSPTDALSTWSTPREISNGLLTPMQIRTRSRSSRSWSHAIRSIGIAVPCRSKSCGAAQPN